MVGVDGREFVIADIPGLIAGAHAGRGVGDRFLGHVERCAVLLHIVDGTSETMMEDYDTIIAELHAYGGDLAHKPRLTVLNKIDAHARSRSGGGGAGLGRGRRRASAANVGGFKRRHTPCAARPLAGGCTPRTGQNEGQRTMAPLTDAQRVVVKIGSALLVDAATGRLRQQWLASVANDIAWLRGRGADVVVVSSGSIALGRSVLRLGASALTLEQSQAAAAVGQIQLAQAYQTSLAAHGITTGQVLVTLEDSANRRRYLNSRATLSHLIDLGVVPIVNENDTVATDEIRYGDNDRLAAQIAVTVGADVLILLSDIDGFYSANPHHVPDATRFDVIDQITPTLEAMAGDAGTGLSKGGMKTKLMAAKLVMGAGCAMAITKGQALAPLQRLARGGAATWFMPSDDPRTARKKWIASMKPQGVLRVDAGALAALRAGKSLLPVGVTAVTGTFERGDPVVVQGADGGEEACGLAAYSATDAQALMGHPTDRFEAILGHRGRSALIHRDDLVLYGKALS